MTSGEIKQKSKSIFDKIIEKDFFEDSKTIMCYVSNKNEVYTHSFIEYCKNLGKKIVIPSCTNENNLNASEIKNLYCDTKENCFGILEPKQLIEFDKSKIDLIIVPAIAFDVFGNRIGYGKGYFDKFLSDSIFAKIVGVCFDFQILKDLPYELHDKKVNMIFTEKREINVL